MAMINLTIVASVADEDLPPVVYITGSQSKLNEMDGYALIQNLRKRGTRVVLIDRKDPNIISKLTEFGRPHVVWTNYASKETYEQASAIMADGGNLNSYAGAVDPDLTFTMPIGEARVFSSFEEEAKSQLWKCIQWVSVDPNRYRGLAKEPKVAPDFRPCLREIHLNEIPDGVSVTFDSGSRGNTSVVL